MIKIWQFWLMVGGCKPANLFSGFHFVIRYLFIYGFVIALKKVYEELSALFHQYPSYHQPRCTGN